jgi:hypothetical protein
MAQNRVKCTVKRSLVSFNSMKIVLTSETNGTIKQEMNTWAKSSY